MQLSIADARSARIFGVQVFFSAVMVIFCIAQLWLHSDSDTRSVFLPILTSIVGVWLPSPSASSGLAHEPPLAAVASRVVSPPYAPAPNPVSSEGVQPP